MIPPALKTVLRVFNSTQCMAAVAAYLRGKDIAKCMLDIAELIYQCSGDEEGKRSANLGGTCQEK